MRCGRCKRTPRRCAPKRKRNKRRRDSLDLAREQFRLGTITYLTLDNAERTYQQARINLVQAQASRYADTAALFQALGGGWWNRNDVAPDAIGRPDRFGISLSAKQD